MGLSLYYTVLNRLPITGWADRQFAVALLVRCVKREKTHDQGSADPRGCGIGSSGHQTLPLEPLERPRAEGSTPESAECRPERKENRSCDASSSHSRP